MCGLYGWNFNSHKGIGATQRETLAGVLAICNSERGDDAYGAYVLRSENRAEIVKRVGDIAEASGVSAWGRAALVMAHTRQATHGAVIPANCHPFQVGGLTLAHNGVISNHAELNRLHDRKCAVDSEHLVLHMAEGKPFAEIQGYGTISWVDAKDGAAVKLCRMRSGSLAIYGVTLGRGKGAPQIGTVWSSDERHLRRALDAAGLNFFPYEKPEEGVVQEVKGGKLWITDERYNLGTPTYISQETWNLTRGVKTPTIMAPSALPWRFKDDPIVLERAMEIANDDRPASWAQRRMSLANDLGLTAVTEKLWADKDGSMISADDLDDIMESDVTFN